MTEEVSFLHDDDVLAKDFARYALHAVTFMKRHAGAAVLLQREY